MASAYASGNYTDETYVTSQFAAGIQDNIFLLNKRVLLVGGARFDDIQNAGAVDNYAKTEGLSTGVTNWVYKASGVFFPLPTRDVSLFVNYSQTFTPEYGTTFPGSGVQLKPLQGVAKEVGIKAELFNSQLIGTFSYFHDELDNNPIFYLINGRNIAVQNGVAKFPGYDADVTWKINDNFAVLLAVSDVNSSQVDGDGFRNAQIGFNSKGLIRYTFSRDTALKGLAIGVGVKEIAKRYGSNNDSYLIPGYTDVDAFATYTFARHWRLQANVYNVTNTQAVLSALGNLVYNYAVWPINCNFSVKFTY